MILIYLLFLIVLLLFGLQVQRITVKLVYGERAVNRFHGDMRFSMGLTVLFSLFFSFSPISVLEAHASLQVYDLRCEQQVSPLGIDTQKPCFSWKLQSNDRNVVQTSYQIEVATSVEQLVKSKANVWTSGKIASNKSVLVPFGGRHLASATSYYWRVRSWSKTDSSRWSQPAVFTTGLMNAEDWGKAQWIAMEKDDSLIIPAIHFPLVKTQLGDKKVGFYKMPQFRKVVNTPKKVLKALAYVCGLGQFDFFINGQKVGDHFLDPGWTKYDKEALYVCFDVTRQLRQGKNVLGVMLGNGFYNIPRERYFKLLGSYGAPKLKFRLVVRYDDGSEQDFVSDRSWRVTSSPIVYSSIYGGEDYDASLEQKGWKKDVHFDDSKWQRALKVEQNIPLKAQIGTHLIVRQRIPVVGYQKNGKGSWTYDLGQNFSGIIRVRIKSKGGQSVYFRPGELQKADKTIAQGATGSPYYFKYTTKEGLNEWQPQFSYYGFRYVQVEGAVPAGQDNPNGLPEIELLEGIHTSNEAKEVGGFECSKPLFNQIFHLIDWAIRSNMASILTDCPHREKLGWLEQSYLMQHSLQYRYDLLNLYTKIMDDMEDSQWSNGAIPTIAPEYVRFADGFEDTPEWGSAFIVCPWQVYQWYGDKRLIEAHYPAMKHYMSYLATRAKQNILAYGLGDWFDIGPKRPGYAQLTSNGVTATATYYQNALIMSQVAELLGEKEDQAHFSELAENIKKAYNREFFHSDNGYYDRNSQTANAISLVTGLVDDSEKERVVKNLIDDIKGRNNALTAGDIGYCYLLRALEQAGQSELIDQMNSKYDVPGYGWQLAHGATALTESWQAYGNVSNNHLMLGHLMEWLFSGLGGISQQAGSVGFQKVNIDPQIVSSVNFAKTTYESAYGLIRCEWQRTNDDFVLKLEIPCNCTASVCLPSAQIENITEYGSPITEKKEIQLLKKDVNSSTWEVGSGVYLFTVKR